MWREVRHLLRCKCLPLLGRVRLLHHLPYSAGPVEGLKEVAVSLESQLLEVKIPLGEVRQPSDLGVGSICNLAKEIIDFEHDIRLPLGGKLPSTNLHGFL